ncbi:MAG: VOC family protein [Leptospiraceae bacterium]|nr:VOC family protein [Leptospiraceae bacterium]
MQRVTGIGGIFFKCADPARMREWYDRHLGIVSHPEAGAIFEWQPTGSSGPMAAPPRESANSENDTAADSGSATIRSRSINKGFTIWSPFAQDTQYFNPSKSGFMINFRVRQLEELLVTLRAEGVTIVGEMETYEYGKFAWILDPEQNKIELWEPNDAAFDQMTGQRNPMS